MKLAKIKSKTSTHANFHTQKSDLRHLKKKKKKKKSNKENTNNDSPE